jgi:hypothetical protein
MTFYDPMKPKKSIGALRKATKTKPRSPDLTGKIALQRHTTQSIIKQFDETESDEILANLAGWINHDSNGQYLSVEISPKYVRHEQPMPEANNLDFIFNDQEDNN